MQEFTVDKEKILTALTLGPVQYRNLRTVVTPWAEPTFLELLGGGLVAEVEDASLRTIQITQFGVDFLVSTTVKCV